MEPAYIATITPYPEDPWMWDVEVTAGERVIFRREHVGIGVALDQAGEAIFRDNEPRF